MANEATVTIRVPRELKERIDTIAHDLCISQSAVWKILISHYFRPVADGNLHETLEAVILRAGDPPGTASGRGESAPRRVLHP